MEHVGKPKLESANDFNKNNTFLPWFFKHVYLYSQYLAEEGLSMHGILPLWKPKGMTSHDCVMKIRRIFGTKKVGHTGTLDPEVEGVLTICIGNATKLVPFLTVSKKTYIAECCLGVATETEDAHGAIIEEKEFVEKDFNEQINQTLQKFQGVITQVPPMYSAVKVNGKKLYEYARANQEVERPIRQITIFHLERIPVTNQAENKFSFKVVCSQGTYIRTLCVDIGRELGYPAHMSHLIRTEAGSFTQADTYTFEELEQAKQTGTERELLVPMLEGIKDMVQIEVDNDIRKRVLNGQKLPVFHQQIPTGPFAIISNNQLLAIYQIHPENNEEIKPIRVFNK